MAGTIVLTNHYELGDVKAVVLTCTADASDASFPATTLASLGLGDISGTILAIESNPGGTAPTDDWDLTLIDGDGLDRLNGLGANFDTTTSERRRINAVFYQGETLTVTIANNSVNSAVIVLTITYTPAAATYPRVTALGGTVVEGNVAHDAADAGNPVKVGGIAATTPTMVDVGDRVQGWMTRQGAFVIGGVGAVTDAATLVAAIGIPGNSSFHALGVAPLLWDGAALIRGRTNIEGTALASAARTATVSSSDITNYDARGVHVFVNATAASDTPSVVFTIEAKGPISGTYTALLTSAAVTGISHTVLTVYPGITAAANVAASMVLPRTWRVTATHADADSITYSVGYALVK